MKLCIVGPTYPSKSGIAHHATLLYEVARRRHDVRFVAIRSLAALKRRGRAGDPSRMPFAAAAVDAVLDPVNPRSWAAAARCIGAFAPDAVLVTWWSTTFKIVALHAMARRVRRLAPAARVVYWCHEVRPRRPEPLWIALTRRALALPDAHVVHADHQAEWLTRLRPDATIIRLPLPVLDMFAGGRIPAAVARERLGVPADAALVLFFGYAAPYKGLDDLLAGLALARPDVPALHLLVAGEFPNGSAAFRERVRELGLAAAVTLIDRYVPNEDVATLFSAADVLVLPYRDATQSGVAALGVGFGIPIIASDVASVRDTVVDGNNGLLVPPRAPAALAHALGCLFRDDLRDRLAAGMRARQPALSSEHLLAALERLCGRDPAGQ